MARCPVTGELTTSCECGAHDDDDTPEPWRTVPFQSPSGEAA